MKLYTKKGFTLVELLIVIAIISILVTVVLIAINPRRIISDTNDTKKRTELNQIKTSLQLYFNDNGAYPDDAADLIAELEPDYNRDVPKKDFYGYKKKSDTDYLLGAVMDEPSPDDIATFTKCGEDPSTGVNDLKRLDSTSTNMTAITQANGSLVCPD